MASGGISATAAGSVDDDEIVVLPLCHQTQLCRHIEEGGGLFRNFYKIGSKLGLCVLAIPRYPDFSKSQCLSNKCYASALFREKRKP